ncbi:ABC transporter ATP-binding protein [Intrasporangium calvum]|uniref:ABC transporter related protein n=1 Tax=Intrasporangium calvum (strain ATCC 23552 / DSM 43043 / JCM 3097 / NBRC 12989 / NCIMB 10167 / NRRL B-3866 / 7 KIP) TaxID=710696 RepID=E6S9F2_INTC7|nr:ABC transporter ATP-binding protein [Intrasporangium calvum]ADU48148.1 ABC transporter related protein [Intrasporangium calvum DSM 43043]
MSRRFVAPVEHHGVASGRELSTWATLRRGIQLSPQLRRGIGVTVLLAGLSTLGRVLVPFVVQRVTDEGILGSGGPRPEVVLRYLALALAGVVVTALSAYLVNVRLFRSSETGLATLRVHGFRHIHDLAMLTQNTERRGSLVSRVTSDVDTISMFVQFGGLMLLVNVAQISLATVLMLVYSPLLALVVWACFVPLFFIIRLLQGVVGRGYTTVRERVGDLLAAISEAVVGAQAIRAYGVEERTAQRIDSAIENHRAAAIAAQARAVLAFTSGQLVAGLTTAVVLVVGTVLAAGGRLTLGELLAFLFLVNLFTMPVQQATEILNEMQNAVAGWRRVIGIIDTPADVADPASGRTLPRGPITVRFDDVGFAYPGGAAVLHDIDLTIAPRSRVAVVGETGSGKSTLAKLLTRLMDPSSGRVLLDDTDVRELAFASLRQRVVLVPQEGFLFDATLLENIRFGRPGATDAEIRLTVTELGLDGWVATLPLGLATHVGQRGESLSAGERQLVALARAYLADPDLLVLDEATSAVDPGTEIRLQRALDSLTRGRTSIAIAHRLSTAEAADEVVVVDDGRIVERGTHTELVGRGGVYSRLHESWVAQQREP